MRGILIVDDLAAARTAIRALLDSHSVPISGEARNGKEAIEKVKKLRPDLVLLDINMPEMDGILAAYEIRRISPPTKIVFLTIHDYPPFLEITKMVGDGCVAKAVADKLLIPTLHQLLEGTQTKRGGRIRPPATTPRDGRLRDILLLVNSDTLQAGFQGACQKLHRIGVEGV